MTRRFGFVIIALIAGVAFAPRPAQAEIYATTEAMCEEAARASPPRAGQDAVVMKEACQTAAVGRMKRAARLTGVAKQQEVVMEATYLYFAAEGAARSNNKDFAVRALLTSRDLYRGVRDHPASATMRRKGQLGLDTVNRTLVKR